MSDWFRRSSNGADELGVDPVLTEALRALDPATDDPGYWPRFRGWVMSGAARELARRRLINELTIGDVLTAWARTLLPTAALAAALATIMLLRAAEPGRAHSVSVEELLVTDLPSESVSMLLSSDAGEVAVPVPADAF